MKDKNGLIVFDCFGTLLTPPKNKAYSKFLNKLNLHKKELYKTIITKSKIDWKLMHSLNNPGSVFKDEWLEELNYDLKMESFDIKPYPNTLETLKLLRKDYTVVILSNLAEGYEHSIEILLSDYVDKIFYSFDIGYAKPDEESIKTVYEWYLLTSGRYNENINLFLLDDKVKNILMANKIGFNGYLIHSETTIENIKKVKDISEFERVVYKKSQL